MTKVVISTKFMSTISIISWFNSQNVFSSEVPAPTERLFYPIFEELFTFIMDYIIVHSLQSV